MTMPERIRESVQAAVDSPVDAHELLRNVQSRPPHHRRLAPLAAAAAVLAVAAGAGLVLQNSGVREPGPADPGEQVIPFVDQQPVEADVPPPALGGGAIGSQAGCSSESVTARIVWSRSPDAPAELRGEIRVMLTGDLLATGSGCGLASQDPELVLLGPADGQVGPKSTVLQPPAAPQPPQMPSRYVSPERDVVVPVALSGSNCVRSSAGSVLGLGPSFIGINFEGDKLPCDPAMPPSDGTLALAPPRTEGTPAALLPADRKGLRVTLELPEEAIPGKPLRYLVRVANPTTSPISLNPCPAYQTVFGWSDTESTSTFSGTGRLNCDAAPDALTAGEELVFEMIQTKWQPSSATRKPVKLAIRWGIAGPEAASGALPFATAADSSPRTVSSASRFANLPDHPHEEDKRGRHAA